MLISSGVAAVQSRHLFALKVRSGAPGFRALALRPWNGYVAFLFRVILLWNRIGLKICFFWALWPRGQNRKRNDTNIHGAALIMGHHWPINIQQVIAVQRQSLFALRTLRHQPFRHLNDETVLFPLFTKALKTWNQFLQTSRKFIIISAVVRHVCKGPAEGAGFILHIITENSLLQFH